MEVLSAAFALTCLSILYMFGFIICVCLGRNEWN